MEVYLLIMNDLWNQKPFPSQKKILHTTALLFKALKISCVNLNMASSVADPFLKPNCCPNNILLLLVCSVSLLYKAFSKTFERGVNSDMGL